MTTPEVVPTCATTEAGVPVFDDGASEQWTDPSGVVRRACVFRPVAAAPSSLRPLVIFLHGGGGGLASDVYNFTTLRAKAETYDLSGDPTRPGFFLISVQGRSLHYPTNNPRDGHHHDFYYRDLSSPSTNPDIANVDRLIDALVAEGAVDPQRIYLMGWSNGGFFSQMYGVARHDRSTPGGNRVAAVSVYSAADPFNNTNSEQVPSCQLDPYPTSPLPVMLVSRSCDLVACDQAQADGFANFEHEPGHIVEPWINDLTDRVGATTAVWLRIRGNGAVTNTCAPIGTCALNAALVNHMRWPNGVRDGGGVDHEPAMLDFLKMHPGA